MPPPQMVKYSLGRFRQLNQWLELARTFAPRTSLCCGGMHSHEHSEAAWWRSMEELVPVFEQEGGTLNMEPHPEDWCETLHPAIDMLKTIGSKNVRFLYCAPHTFYFGDDMAKMIHDAGSLIAHVHVADTYN